MGSFLVEKSIVLQHKRVSEDSGSNIPILMMHGESSLPSTSIHDKNDDFRYHIYDQIIEHQIYQVPHTK